MYYPSIMKFPKKLTSNQSFKCTEAHYDIKTEDTTKQLYYASNNDGSVKNIGCHLKDQKNITIDGNGALLYYHGRISPFVIDTCENITIKNITIDYDRPFYTQGTILEASESRVVLAIDKQFPYRVEGKNLIITSESWENDLHDGIMLFQEFSPEKCAPAYNSPVLIYRIGEDAEVDPTAPLPMKILTAEALEDNKIALHGEFPHRYDVGNILVMTHEFRHNSGIFIYNSKNIILENIEIVHAGAMGVIAQLSENITLNNVKVGLFARSKGIVSTNCDATHFVACSGKINIIGCQFDNMMDDGVNIHGVYTSVSKVVSTNTLQLQISHFQQEGVPLYKDGDMVTITKGHTTQLCGQFTVKKASMLSLRVFEVVFEEKVTDVGVGDFVENQTTTPEVYIYNTKTGRNRPRGFLLTTPKKVLVENCLFYSSCYGIHIAGDSMFWYESGSVKDVTITGCSFIDCGCQMGDYCIGITPEFEKTAEHPYFHHNITITNNSFKTFTDGIIFADGVEGLVVSDNSYEQTKTYQKRISSGLITVV